jgi:N-acetylglutamate synthase-like GNAT family acetyltransferase
MIETLAPAAVCAGPGSDDSALAGINPSIIDVTINERVFGIRAADIDTQRNSASMLISKMYAWRGYSGNHQIGDDPNRITLTASDRGQIFGTLSLGLDSEIGLMADQVFADYVDTQRSTGKVCEIIKLAVDPAVKSKAVLASLFHVALIYARDLNGCSHIFIEVNPRHRRFYEVMLGFQTVCESRPNPRVQAPAVLLSGSTAYGTEQIAKWGGMQDKAVGERSLFPWFFSQREEAGIINRLRQLG